MNTLLTLAFVPLFTWFDQMVAQVPLAQIDPSGCTPVASFDEAGQSIYNYINGAKGTIAVVVAVMLVLSLLIPSKGLRGAALGGLIAVLGALAFFDEVPVVVDVIGGGC